jgi:ADP-heptose:LPS heptosyltransferase
MQMAGVEIHFLTKEVFKDLLVANPYLSRIHTFKKDVPEVYGELKKEKFDLVIDLHRNLRSLRLKNFLKRPSRSFDKINFKKLLAVRLKLLNVLPKKHIVERYIETIEHLGVRNDGKGLDCFIPASQEINAAAKFFGGKDSTFLALVIGGSYHTKKIPVQKLKHIISLSRNPVVLMGGPEDVTLAATLQSQFPEVIDACGKLSIMQSASLIKQASWVITSDTGLMHIAAAFNKRIISVWGNTIPEFGMGPYRPHTENKILEINGLSCRPCSKLGYAKCPRGHFKCMLDIQYDFIAELD